MGTLKRQKRSKKYVDQTPVVPGPYISPTMLRPKFISTISTYFAVLLGMAIASAPLLAMAQQYKPPQRGIPGRREGGGTRGGCIQAQKLPFMPLIPADAFSVTVSNRPTFFWYVPATNAKTAEFRLLDQSERQVYRMMVELPGTSGIVGVTLPETVATTVLESGKDYYWQFSVICDSSQPSKNPFVEGAVRRTSLPVELALTLGQTVTPRDRATIYATNGIWQDAITTLAQERCLRPQDNSALTGWRTLLQSVRLGEYAQLPLTSFCKANRLQVGQR